MGLLLDSLMQVSALALPPRCCGCGEPVAADHQFCARCWQGLRFLAPPWCAGCNLPFEYDRGAGACCARCIATPPRHAGIRATVAYGPIARRLALKLKYGGRIGVAETMARLIERQVPATIDLLVPVPLHRWRLWSRGYNQAALIAAALGRRRGIRDDGSLLVRTRRTPVLRGLGPKARSKAVAGAFRVSDAARLKGRHVGLVDDVLTSGATAEACTRTLLRAGAASVTILCWARVLPGDGD